MTSGIAGAIANLGDAWDVAQAVEKIGYAWATGNQVGGSYSSYSDPSFHGESGFEKAVRPLVGAALGEIAGGVFGGVLDGALNPDTQAAVAALVRYGKTGQLNQYNADQLAKIMGEDQLPGSGSQPENNNNPEHKLFRVVEAFRDGKEVYSKTYYTYNPPNQFLDYVTYSVVSVSEWITTSGANEPQPIPTDYPFIANPHTDGSAGPALSPSPIGGISAGGKSATFDAGGKASLDGDNGTFTLNADGSFSYQPHGASTLPVGSHPSDSFTYALVNVNGGAPSTYDVVLNRAPIAPSVNLTVSAGQGAKTDAAHGVLAKAADLDGDALSVSGVNRKAELVGTSIAGTYGHLTLNADGSYTYIANQTSALAAATCVDGPCGASGKWCRPVGVQSCVRPVDAALMTAGPDEVRDWGPYQAHAL